jgi:hypothetical protein
MRNEQLKYCGIDVKYFLVSLLLFCAYIPAAFMGCLISFGYSVKALNRFFKNGRDYKTEIVPSEIDEMRYTLPRVLTFVVVTQ